MKHTYGEIINALKVIRDECLENMSRSQGCDLCRSGKQIIVYGVDYDLDTKSEYHRIEPKYCPVCGSILEKK